MEIRELKQLKRIDFIEGDIFLYLINVIGIARAYTIAGEAEKVKATSCREPSVVLVKMKIIRNERAWLMKESKSFTAGS